MQPQPRLLFKVDPPVNTHLLEMLSDSGTELIGLVSSRLRGSEVRLAAASGS